MSDALLQDWQTSALSEQHIEALSAIVGAQNVLTSLADRYAYCRDRLPYGTFRLRNGTPPGTLPSAIVSPADQEQVTAIVQLANRVDLRLIPFGAGSGVLGGTVPVSGEVVVDLKRLNRILDINETDGTVTVQAGMNGGHFEQQLNARGYTAQHLPQSIYMSTVGGWAACRGAGQASSKYGKIEDIVLGLKAVLPNGRQVEVRPVARRAVGPSIKDLLVGSEGVYGFITELTLRIWRQPEYEHGVVVAFPSLEAGLDALRDIVQHELRPTVMRLYDHIESAQRTEGIAEFRTHPILCILKFSGMERLAKLEEALSLELCAVRGGLVTSDSPYRHWEETRYMSYSTKWQTSGYYMDTIEITGAWSRLPKMYAEMRRAAQAIHPGLHFGAHWSHIYPEGACQYMTIRLPPMDDATALVLHRKAWDEIERICLSFGGSTAHHHGAGLFRNEWLREELNAGLDMLQILKDGIDPKNLLNPGKLGLRPASGSAPIMTGGVA